MVAEIKVGPSGMIAGGDLHIPTCWNRSSKTTMRIDSLQGVVTQSKKLTQSYICHSAAYGCAIMNFMNCRSTLAISPKYF
jgi:hypothetical protein